MSDSEYLTREQTVALQQRQKALQTEAQAVLADLKLREVLSAIGPVRLIGSSVYGLMVWRDIDLNVSAAAAQTHQVWEAMLPLLAHPHVKQLRYLKEFEHFNPASEHIHDRHYVAIAYLPSQEVEWKIDISFWLCGEHPEPIHDALLRDLTEEKRLVILWLKDIWYRLPAYRRQVYSTDIYDAVLRHGVSTPVEFDNYLAARGKPTRARQAS